MTHNVQFIRIEISESRKTWKTYPKGQLPKVLDDFEWVERPDGSIEGPDGNVGTPHPIGQPADPYLGDFLIDLPQE